MRKRFVISRANGSGHQMPIEIRHIPKYGHPWTGGGEWDVLDVRTDTAEELQAVLEAGFAMFWQPWIHGAETIDDIETGRFAAAVYKPTDAMRPWFDKPLATVGRVQHELTWLEAGDHRWVLLGQKRQDLSPAPQVERAIQEAMSAADLDCSAPSP